MLKQMIGKGVNVGYTHYQRRKRVLAVEPFRAFVDDARIIINYLSQNGLKLAGTDATGDPVLKNSLVSFNGAQKCDHPEDSSICIPWPADDAGGIATRCLDNGGTGKDDNAISGRWYAGIEISTRVCDGDCSYETFHLPRVFKPEVWQQADKNRRYFDFCKTAFRPYDLAVIAVLIAFKKHFGDEVEVSSDGRDAQWFDGKLLCARLLDYGFEFEINDDHELVRKADFTIDKPGGSAAVPVPVPVPEGET